MGEDVDDELPHVVEDGAPLLHGPHDRGEVVVHEHHVGGLACHVGSGQPHGHPDVGALEGRSVVHTVPGHRDDLAHVPQQGHDSELVLGRRPGEDRRPRVEDLPQRLVRHSLEVARVHHRVVPLVHDADLPGDRLRREAVVPGDHVDADAGDVALRHGVRYLRSRRVVHAGQAGEDQLLLDPARMDGGDDRLVLGGQVPVGHREHPHARPSHPVVLRHRLVPERLRERDLSAVEQRLAAVLQQLSGGALHVRDEQALLRQGPVDRGHPFPLGLERELADHRPQPRVELPVEPRLRRGHEERALGGVSQYAPPLTLLFGGDQPGGVAHVTDPQDG